MKLIKNKYLSLVMMMSFLLILALTPFVLTKAKEMPIRSIDTSNSSVSLEVKLEKFKEKLDIIETVNEGDFSYLTADLIFNQIDLVSTEHEGENVQNTYMAGVNYSEDTFTIKSQTIVNGRIEESNESIYFTEYNESSGEFYLNDNNGNKINIISEIEKNNVEECFALTLTTGFAALIAALAAMFIVVPPLVENAPDISSAFGQLIDGVVDGVRNFWGDLKLTFGGITAIALPQAIQLTEQLAEKLYKEAEKRSDYYLLCGVIGSDTPIPILYKFTCERNAANWIKKGGSVWSPYSSSARSAIKKAGYKAGDSKGVVNCFDNHENSKMPTFNHFHALTKKLKKVKDVHSFFGLPY